MEFRMIAGAALGMLFALSLIANWFLISEKRELETALKAATEYADRLKDDMRRQAEALSERDAEISRLSRDRNALSRKLKAAAERDPEAKAWAGMKVPDAVDELLRRERKILPDTPPEWDHARIISKPEGM